MSLSLECGEVVLNRVAAAEGWVDGYDLEDTSHSRVFSLPSFSSIGHQIQRHRERVANGK
jgi:hypothetical protein